MTISIPVLSEEQRRQLDLAYLTMIIPLMIACMIVFFKQWFTKKLQ